LSRSEATTRQRTAGNRAAIAWLTRQAVPRPATADTVQAADRCPANYYEPTVSDTLNIASTAFSPAGYVGLTLPVFNGQRVVRIDPERPDDPDSNDEPAVRRQAEADLALARRQALAALAPPDIDQQVASGHLQYRLLGPGRNTGSALVLAPTQGPWSARISSGRARRVLTLDLEREHPEILARVLPALPTDGEINLTATEERPDAVRAHVRAHERLHAADWRRVFTVTLDAWQQGLTAMAEHDDWFDSRVALDEAVARAGLVEQEEGHTALEKLASRLVGQNSIAVGVLHTTEPYKPQVFDASFDGGERHLVVRLRIVRAADLSPLDGAS
jgi:hypothetical protein